MRPTRRGWSVAGLVVLAVVLAAMFGARALNAVAAPALVALLAGAVQVRRRDPPEVSRDQPLPGFPGERRTVRIEFDEPVVGRVHDEVGEGLTARGNRAVLGGQTAIEYDLRLGRRGERRLGPLTVTVRDVLGTFEREFRYAEPTTVLVYPEVYALAGGREVAPLIERVLAEDRRAFDRLREYVPGDALRNVHWKSSAKRPGDDLLVVEFSGADEEGIAVVGESTAGNTDAMAAAVASVALFALDADLGVDVVVPGGSLERPARPAEAEDHRERVLGLLARTPGGRVAPERRADADVLVAADDEGVTVAFEGREVGFDRLADDADPAVAADGGTPR